MEVVVTSGAISRARLQSNHYHQQTNIQFFYRPDALPVTQPTVSKHWRENITIHGLAYPKLTWGLPTLSLTTSYKLYKQSFVNRCLFCDCYWHVLLCGTYKNLIWYHFSPHNWMAFVSLNKWHVMLCYVMLCRLFCSQTAMYNRSITKFISSSNVT